MAELAAAGLDKRLPAFDDLSNLPFLGAVFNEARACSRARVCVAGQPAVSCAATWSFACNGAHSVRRSLNSAAMLLVRAGKVQPAAAVCSRLHASMHGCVDERCARHVHGAG
jgi:hypothetical protein